MALPEHMPFDPLERKGVIPASCLTPHVWSSAALPHTRRGYPGEGKQRIPTKIALGIGVIRFHGSSLKEGNGIASSLG